MLQLKCTGLILTPVNALDCAEGSIDVQVKIEFDNTYAAHTKTLHIGYFDERGVEHGVSSSLENNVFKIPGPVFAQAGIIFISVHFSKTGDTTELETNAVQYRVQKTAGGVGSLPGSYIWEPIVKGFVNDYLESNEVKFGTDTTLTQSGKAADAKAVGDEFSKLWEDIVEQNTEIEQLKGTIEDLEVGGVTDETIQNSVNKYLEENPIEVDLSGKQDTLVSGSNIKTVNGQSLLGSGDITIEGGSSGTTNYGDLTNKPQINGIELVGNKTSGDLGIGTPTNEQVANAVETWLNDNPSATTTVGNRSLTESKIQYKNIHKMLLDDDLQSHLSNYEKFKLSKEIACGKYTQAQISSDGTLDTSKVGQVSDLLECYPNEVLILSNVLTTKIAYYDESKNFISLVSTSSGVEEYTTPSNACYYRLQNVYSYGTIPSFTIRNNKPKNRTFKDLIMSPLKCRPSICFTGDSNTYGYGLSVTSLSWANRFIEMLQSITMIKLLPSSKWVKSVGCLQNATAFNFKQNSYMEIETDTTSITLNEGVSYDSTWAWYIDGVTDSANDNLKTITLDGEKHTVRVMFKGGQLVTPSFEISKTITCVNKAVSGVNLQNVSFEHGHDWLIIMVGTNNRNDNVTYFERQDLVEYSNKGTWIMPIPTYRIDDMYQISLFESVARLSEYFESIGFDVINCNAELSSVFSTTQYLQGDLIHFTENGHVIICNTVSAKLGLPTYLSTSES